VIRALALALLLALPAQAEEPHDFDSMLEAIGTAMQTDDIDAPFIVINRALRSARAEGRLTADWALFFAMAADHVRNQLGNPAFALSLTEEGLALIAGDAYHADTAAALRVSGAYALADLGRMDEAVAAVRLALPEFRDTFGDEAATDLASTAALWAEGQLGDYNTSVMDLASDALDRAQEAANSGAFGRAISLAGAALLPPGGDLDPGTVRARNAQAELLIAGSLRALGRHQDAANAYLRAINRLARAPWQEDAPSDWWPEADLPEGTALLFGAFQSLAGLAISGGALDLAIAALASAKDFARDPREQITLLIYQAVLADRDGDSDRALAIIAESRNRAAEAGETATVRMADFYAAQVALLAARRAGDDPDPAPLVAAAEAALGLGDSVDTTTILTDTARFLTRTADHQAALSYARRALALRRATVEDMANRDSAFGQAQSRAAQRGALEIFLRAASNAAVAEDPTCEDPSRDAWYSCVITAP
jgi:tetratricopeptide (TPR) repeat protein